jgi:hypothetical protein
MRIFMRRFSNRNGSGLALLPIGTFRYPENRFAGGIADQPKAFQHFGESDLQVRRQRNLIFLQYTHGREAATRWNDCPEDHVNPPIGLDSRMYFGWRSMKNQALDGIYL